MFSKGDAVTYNVVSTTVIEGVAGGRIVFTLTDVGGGDFTFDLDDQVDHLPLDVGGGDLEILTLDLTVAFSATASGGGGVTLANNSITVEVENDVPARAVELEPVTATVKEDGMSITTGDGDLSEGNKESGETNTDDEASGTADNNY